MKKHLLTTTALTVVVLGAGAAPALAGLNFDVHLGSPAPVVVVQDSPRFVIERRPRFLYTPSLGFYVSVDGPYDIVYYEDRYYPESRIMRTLLGGYPEIFQEQSISGY